MSSGLNLLCWSNRLAHSSVLRWVKWPMSSVLRDIGFTNQRRVKGPMSSVLRDIGFTNQNAVVWIIGIVACRRLCQWSCRCVLFGQLFSSSVWWMLCCEMRSGCSFSERRLRIVLRFGLECTFAMCLMSICQFPDSWIIVSHDFECHGPSCSEGMCANQVWVNSFVL